MERAIDSSVGNRTKRVRQVVFAGLMRTAWLVAFLVPFMQYSDPEHLGMFSESDRLTAFWFFVVANAAVAYAWRGGPTYWVLNTALLDRRGSVASRWSYASRALALWIPFTVGVSFIRVYVGEYTQFNLGLLVFLVALVLTELTLAFRSPRRGLADWIVGTRLAARRPA